MLRKRFAAIVAVITLIVVGLGGTASAHGDDDRGWTVTVNRNPVSWTLTSEQCPNLPAGTELTGEGHELFTRKTRTDRLGVTHLLDTSKKHGAVVDNAGNTYRFDYLNTVWAVSSNGVDFAGIMSDVFSVKGRGPATLRNGFVAQVQFDTAFTYFSADPIIQFGNPFQFPSGPGICDPI